MFIIIEGLDRSGKSTLAEIIARDFNFKLIHCSKPQTNNPYQEYLQLFQEYEGQDVVFDRFYLGEYVYSNLYRDGCTISDFQFWVFDMLAKKNDALLIYSSTDAKTIYNRCVATNESLAEFNYNNDINKAIELFNEIILKKSSLNPIFYDSAKCSAQTFVAHVQPLIERRTNTSFINSKLNTIDARSTGSRNAEIMIVGEQLRPKATLNEYPFSSGTSSEYLYSTLKESNLYKKDIYLTNAFKPWLPNDDVAAEILKLEIQWIKPKTIVFLGQKAADFATKYEIDDDSNKIMIPHPSYWKRFHYEKLKEYAEMFTKGVDFATRSRISYRV